MSNPVRKTKLGNLSFLKKTKKKKKVMCVMIKQSNYEDIKRSWQVELTQSEAIINHWLHETTFPKLLTPHWRAQRTRQTPLCVVVISGKKKKKKVFVSLCCSAPTAEVTSRVVPPGSRSALRCCLPSKAELTPSHPRAPPALQTPLETNNKKRQKKMGGGGGGKN